MVSKPLPLVAALYVPRLFRPCFSLFVWYAIFTDAVLFTACRAHHIILPVLGLTSVGLPHRQHLLCLASISNNPRAARWAVIHIRQNTFVAVIAIQTATAVRYCCCFVCRAVCKLYLQYLLCLVDCAHLIISACQLDDAGTSHHSDLFHVICITPL